MDFGLDPQQSALIDGLDGLLRRHTELPTAQRAAKFYYDQALDDALTKSGYFDLPYAEGYGPLEAALVLEKLGALPGVVEAGASLLVAPRLLDEPGPRPVAMLSGDLSASHRYLPMAKVAFIDLGDESAALDLAGLEVVASDAIFAYPYGRFARPPDLAAARRLGPGSGAVLRQWWRVSIAIEIAAAMQAGLDFTIAYVKERRVFGRPIGSFQAVQHRLAKIAQLARNLRLMALKAAWSGDAAQAGMACAFGQKAIPRTVFDLHQFNGAMGMTTEHQLHLWTMRLRSLQGELGGVDGAAIAAAKAAWG